MKILPALAALLLATHSAWASTPDPKPTFATPPDSAESQAPRPARAPGVPMALAVEGARKAVETCAAKGFHSAALVTDTAAVPIALVAGDGSAAIAQRLLASKSYLVIKYGMSSSDVITKAETDPVLKAALAADPRVASAHQGGLPIRKNGEIVGAFAVAGSPHGDIDEMCAAPGIALIEAGLK